ncbi:hypothetical protein [Adhaeribacter soli]|uniref:PE-PGRS family protein n=1 Tax=Adhaeribacter soli TaxID=2607655 RepID=A0A5N1J1B2_9BACT|nr:hypothetical protein [Adhaeribacter soli]KAA9340573.1 hypothetical protein F0P94_03860 [Adhaeribacter soli]
MKKHAFAPILFSAFLLLFSACSKEKDALAEGPNGPGSGFAQEPTSTPLSATIKEASGLADSRTAPGNLWVAEDSGNPPQLHLLNYKGQATGKIYLKGATNRDWEDIALAGNTLYVADIGDNNSSKSNYTIYELPEPVLGTDTVREFNRIRFRYPDGPRDAEAVLVDPQTHTIYLLTKRDNPSRIYKLTPPFNYQAIDTATFVQELPFSGVVSAALSPNGSEAILKTYTGLYYYKQQAPTSVDALFRQEPKELAYQIEPQGEAVAFARDNSGFFTLSEKGLSDAVNLYFYKRK